MITPRSEQGSATTELVILTPILVLMLLFVVALGRLASARADVDAAARDAARAAANARNAGDAQTMGTRAARVTLNEGGVTCRTLTVVIATDDFRADGNATATVSCTVDVSGLRVPATHTISGSHTEPIDHYRGAPL